MAPLLSIITVCRNAASAIPATATSIAEQTFQGFEWVVVDGASTDDTLTALRPWRERVSILVSEADAGIYDAMNKGVRLATGQWVLFLNAGDRLHDAGALERFLPHLDASAPLLVHGRVLFLDPTDGFTTVSGGPFTWRRVALGRLPPHPACALRRDWLAAHPFEPRFGIAADVAVIIQAHRSGGSRHVDTLVSTFLLDGLSSRHSWTHPALRDKARALRAMAPGWVGAVYTLLCPLEAARASASHLLRAAGLLTTWRRLKRGRLRR